MHRTCAIALGWLVVVTAQADDRSGCASNDGTYLSGTVVSSPVYQHGHVIQGVELSHTRFSLRSDVDGKTYDVAVDNIFANGFRAGMSGIPAPLDGIAVNERFELCGALYTQGVGIHFVHTNCGNPPTPQHPDGWIRRLTEVRTPGANMEANETYCALFNQGSRGVHDAEEHVPGAGDSFPTDSAPRF